jgi:hypothetical protein
LKIAIPITSPNPVVIATITAESMAQRDKGLIQKIKE